MLADVETMSSLLKPTTSKGIGNPIYESMNLEIDEGCFRNLFRQFNECVYW
jgi:hypothetical protein